MTVIHHGDTPASIAVLHGGPGAPGSAAGLASGLAAGLAKRQIHGLPDSLSGVLEPHQSALTVDGQCEELDQQLKAHAVLPAVLVGWSWGAMLGLLYAARHPELVSQLVMVGCGPLETRYATNIMTERLQCLTPEERREAQQLISSLLKQPAQGASDAELNRRMARFGLLMDKADSVDPIETKSSGVCDYAQHMSIWTEAAKLRGNGEMLKAAAALECPVTIIHGSHDPHPIDGVRRPLEQVHSDVRVFSLENCGHTPWNERQARDEFFSILVDVVANPMK